jgi:N-carbamoyl-L-amino-acid hydrolase
MITINADRLWSRIEALSRFTDPARPWTRRAFDVQFAQGRPL